MRNYAKGGWVTVVGTLRDRRRFCVVDAQEQQLKFFDTEVVVRAHKRKAPR